MPFSLLKGTAARNPNIDFVATSSFRTYLKLGQILSKLHRECCNNFNNLIND